MSASAAARQSPVPSRRKAWLLAGLAVVSVALTGKNDAWLYRGVMREKSEHSDIGFLGKKGTFFERAGTAVPLIVAGAFWTGGLVLGSTEAELAGRLAAEAWAVNGIVVNAIKFLTGRQRPGRSQGKDPDMFKPVRGWDSFPSGHTSSAFAMATAAAQVYTSPWIKALLYGAAALVGLGRVVQSKHWPSDVVAGAIVGYAIAKFLFRWKDWDIRKEWFKKIWSKISSRTDHCGPNPR